MLTKKVRFESPKRAVSPDITSSECQSPRPFIIKRHEANEHELCYKCPNFEPVSRTRHTEYFEHTNTSPYMATGKYILENNPLTKLQVLPCNELELSLLDVSNGNKNGFSHNQNTDELPRCIIATNQPYLSEKTPVSTFPPAPQLQKVNTQQNFINKDNGFFLRPSNLPYSRFSNQVLASKLPENFMHKPPEVHNTNDVQHNSHVKAVGLQGPYCLANKENYEQRNDTKTSHDIINDSLGNCCHEKLSVPRRKQTDHSTSLCHQCEDLQNNPHCNRNWVCNPPAKCDAVNHKRWTIETHENKNRTNTCKCKELASTGIAKTKREPTVADLFKIIKLQNEQLQLLQEKVDKFISAKNTPVLMNQNFVHEHVAVETVNQSNQKMSIGVMTSFEVVRTSTFINKEMLKNQNTQVQCNRSQISIKEVITKSQTEKNFLEGIAPCINPETTDVNVIESNKTSSPTSENVPEDKTLNELSLCNLQIDNATTPQLSPDQTLYLDIRDYSDSDSDQSNAGWTYYNKVMTHVNGMLEDSEMPSSASAMYRNARHVQMQIDKNNISITKRVKFGADPPGVVSQNRNNILGPDSDTSMKMNQLAAKYLKVTASEPVPHQPLLRSAPLVDMSFATRNYMERHKLLQGVPSTSKQQPQMEIPRFLDITALKRQPKLL